MDRKKYTLIGLIVIIIWGTSPAFTRTLGISLGAFTAASIVNIIGGLLAIGHQMLFRGGFGSFKGRSKRYWILCGSLFIIYTATSYISVNIVDSSEVVTLVLVKFLWPLFTLVLTIPMLKQKASRWLVVSVAISLTGIIIAKLGMDAAGGLQQIIRVLFSNGPAYVLGLAVAVSWALYTNFTKLFAEEGKSDGVGIFMLVCGILLGIISIGLEEPRQFSSGIILELLVQSVLVSYLANIGWNLAIKKGNMLVVVLASNFLPIISTAITAWMLHVNMDKNVYLGAVLVVIGTIWSKWCFAKGGTREE